MTQKERELIAIYRGTMVLALLAITQDELDEMEKGGYTFEKELKRHANLFKKTMAKEIARFYKNLPENAEMSYYEITNKVAEKISKSANEVLLELFGVKEITKPLGQSITSFFCVHTA